MFEVLNPTTASIFQNSSPNSGIATFNQALGLFKSSRRSGDLGRFWAKISRASRRLWNLNELENSLRIRNRYYAGIKVVQISKIIGSEGRSLDFDAAFNPLSEKTRDRWLNVASARLQSLPLPAVELIQIDDAYFVRDGHHRISVAAALGEAAVDAQVTVWTISGQLPWQQSESPALLQAQPA